MTLAFSHTQMMYKGGNSYEAEVRMKFAEMDDYITKKNWKTK